MAWAGLGELDRWMSHHSITRQLTVVSPTGLRRKSASQPARLQLIWRMPTALHTWASAELAQEIERIQPLASCRTC